MLNRIRNLIDRLPVDNKLVAAGATYGLTLLVAHVGLELDDVLVPGYLTVSQGISIAAAAVAGYVQPNEGSVLRAEEEDGNPDPELLR